LGGLISFQWIYLKLGGKVSLNLFTAFVNSPGVAMASTSFLSK